jgi:hypothetical protein
MANDYKEHKVKEMHVDVDEEIVTLTTEGEDTRAKHSMTLDHAYSKGLIDFKTINKILV